MGHIALQLIFVGLLTAQPIPTTPVPVPLEGSHAADAWHICGGDWHFGNALLQQKATWYSESSFASTAHVFLKQPALSDFNASFEFYVHPLSNGVGAAEFIFRARNSRTFYLVQFSSRANGVFLVRESPRKHWGVNIKRNYRVPLRKGVWHRVHISAIGAEIKIEVDGKLVISAHDATLPSGLIGFGSSEAVVTFRRIKLEGVPVQLPSPWKDLGGKVKPPPYRIVCADAGAGGYEAFPDICRCANGDLLCVFYAGYAHVSFPRKGLPKGSRVCAVRSTDDGRTWGPPTIVADTPYDDRDPSIVCLRDGTLICNWFTYYGRFRPPQNGKTTPYKEVWLAFSYDNGRTWTKPWKIPQTAGAYWACSSPILELRDGTLLLPLYREYRNPLRNWSAVIRSTDKGKTWSSPYWIDETNDDNDEPVLWELPNGEILCVMRTNGGDSMWVSRSKDKGFTWTRSRKIGFVGQCPYLFRTTQGVLLLGHRRPGTSLHYSLDDGRSWSKNIMIDITIGAYPSMVQLRDGTVLIVYYEEGPGSSIRAQRLRVTRKGVTPIPW